jgi:hypothetical protein
MSNYDEVKFLRRRLREREAVIEAYEECNRKLKEIIVAQQEQIREANDARRVSQHYALKYLRETLLQQDAMDQAQTELNYSLEDLQPHERVCDHRLWHANFRAWKSLRDRSAQ